MRVGVNGMFWHQETTGSGQYVRRLVGEMARETAADRYTLFLPDRSASTDLAEIPPLVETRPLATHFCLGNNLAKVWLEQVAYPRACRRAGVDLAHVPYFAPPLCPVVPTVVTIHDLIPLILPAYRGSAAVRTYMRLVSVAARRASLVLTDSQASARDIARLLTIPLRRLRVVYLAACDIFRPIPRVEREACLARMGVQSPYLLYLGGFDVRKNVTGILRAFELVARRLDGLSLVIAGRPPAKHTAFSPDPGRVVEELGLAERVFLTGHVAEADKPALYGGALAFLFPSFYEGFGLPVLEALSCGTPAIYGEGSSLDEIAGPGGVPVSPGDVPALAEAMLELASNAGLRQQLSANGLSHAASFSWARTAEQTREAYRDALAMA